VYFPKFLSRFIHIPLLSHTSPSHHLYNNSLTLKNLVFFTKSVTQFPTSSVTGKGKTLLNFAILFLEISVNTLYNFPCTTSCKLPCDSLRLRKHSLAKTVIKLHTFLSAHLVGHFLSAVL
jgi:hypothetical protein